MSKKKEEGISNPTHYREMCKPFDSEEEARAAWVAFWNEAYELRNKYRIADVHIIGASDVVGGDGEIITQIRSGHIGDTMKAEVMIARALGVESQSRRALIASLASGDGKEGGA